MTQYMSTSCAVLKSRILFPRNNIKNKTKATIMGPKRAVSKVRRVDCFCKGPEFSSCQAAAFSML